MLPYLRILIFALGAAFFSLFGATVEDFIVEVVRRLIPIDSQNLILFNALNLAAAALPLLGVGLLLNLAVGSEREGRSKVWTLVAGIFLAVTGFRVYQLIWVLRLAHPSAVQPPGPLEFYFLEKMAPFLILGFLAFIPFVFNKSILKINMNIGILTVVLSFMWLWGCGKLQVSHSIYNLLSGFILSNLTLLGSLFLAKKMDLI